MKLVTSIEIFVVLFHLKFRRKTDFFNGGDKAVKAVLKSCNKQATIAKDGMAAC